MTLIELMVVLVIMAMITGAAAIGVMRAYESSRRQETRTRARTLQSAVTAYLLEGHDDCPSVEALARADFLDPTTDHADAWGNAFTIDCDGRAVHVRSPGPDETPGTEDDIGF